jgi:hypothetical protein
MSRLGETELATYVRDELVTFLRDGKINEQRVTETLDITDLQIENIDRLKRIHFCLSDPVVEYIDELQERLRRIKTANQRERLATRGEVRGKIDWEETLKHRYSDSIGDRSHFTCETPYTEYNIGENLVLKKLLWMIHTTVESDLSAIDYEWRTEQWTEERISEFQRIYRRNVHLNRVADGESITLTPRMLNDTRSARQTLYTRAYELYDRYQRLLSNDPDEDVKELLKDTLIIPERLPRLFELFCVFRLLQMLNVEGFKFQVIEPGADQLATLETDSHRVNVYHDRGGNLSFHVPLSRVDEVEEEYFRRYRNTLTRHKRLVDGFLDIESRPSLYSGRPDLVVEIYQKTKDSEELNDIVLGEVKYTDSHQTFSTGLKELIEYIEFAQPSSSVCEQDVTYLDEQETGIRGIVITDGVRTETQTPSGDRITHLTSEDLVGDEAVTQWVPDALLD